MNTITIEHHIGNKNKMDAIQAKYEKTSRTITKQTDTQKIHKQIHKTMKEQKTSN